MISGSKTTDQGQSITFASFKPIKSTCNAPRNVIPWLEELLLPLT